MKTRQFTYAAKLELRQEMMDRLGHSRLDEREDLRVCNDHPIEVKSVSVDIE